MAAKKTKKTKKRPKRASKKSPKVTKPTTAQATPVEEPAPEPTEEEQRQKARDLRKSMTPEQREAKQKKIDDARARRDAMLENQAPTPQKVTPIEHARAKRGDKPVESGPVQLLLDDLHKYKMQVMNQNLVDAEARVKKPIADALQQMLVQKAAQAVQQSPECQKAKQEQVLCLNEIIEWVTPKLPPGYAVVGVADGKVQAQFIPQKAGKPLPVPEVLS